MNAELLAALRRRNLDVAAQATAIAMASDAPPDWIHILPAGQFTGADGRGPWSNPKPDDVVAASITGGRPVPVDYNHQTLFAVLNGGEAPAAGWIDRMDVRDGAVWAHVDWTARGATAVAAKDYRFVSPTFEHAKDGTVRRIVSVGLVNSPNLTELPAINSQTLGDPMTLEEILAQLRAALGLAAETDAPAIVAACTAARTEIAATAAVLAPLGVAVGVAANATLTDLVAAAKTKLETGAPDPAQFVPMAAFQELQTKVSTLLNDGAQSKATLAVNAAMQAGKVSPALKDWAISYASKDPAGFEAWTKAAPAIVKPQGGLVPNGGPPSDGGTGDEAALAVCAKLGITLDAYKAAGKAYQTQMETA